MKLIATRNKQEFWCNNERSYGYVVSNFDIDGDGSGKNPAKPGFHKDPDFQDDTSYKYQGKALNAVEVPFGVLPIFMRKAVPGIVLGCLGRVTNRKTGQWAWFFVGDLGPNDKFGEGSIALADLVGVPSDPVTGGDSDVEFLWEFWFGKQATINGITYPLLKAA